VLVQPEMENWCAPLASIIRFRGQFAPPTQLRPAEGAAAETTTFKKEMRLRSRQKRGGSVVDLGASPACRLALKQRLIL